MKKLFSVVLIAIFLLAGSSFNVVFANNFANESTNIAPLGTAYSSSEKNSLWTPAKTINDTVHGSKTWEGWECAYPTVEKGQDTSKGFSDEYCGIDFGTDFYEISEIKINLGLHTLLGGQNAKYEIKALVEGKWQTVASFEDKNTVPSSKKYSSYDDVMADTNADQRVLADYYVKLDLPVSTNNIRLCISEFGKNYEGGDVKVFPYIYEIELYGKSTEAPEIILPEGATATTNIAWYSYPKASSSQQNHYPYLAIDEDENTYWSPSENDSNPVYELFFDKEYTINKIILKFSGASNISNVSVGIMADGDWIELNIQPNDDFEYLFTPIKATAVRLDVLDGKNIQLVSFEAHLSESKTYYLDKRFSFSQLDSGANGNLAIIGKPYASIDYTPYSSVSYINDGSKLGKQWFSGTVDAYEYCGLKFDYPQKISRAVLTVKTPNVVGTEVMELEIYALINDEFVKIASGESYNEIEGYSTAYTFDEVETTDIRIVFTKTGGGIPNLSEIELFNKQKNVIPMLDGIEPAAWENCTGPDENTNIDEHSCEQKNNGIYGFLTIGILTVVILLGLIVLLKIMKRKNKEV